MRSRNIMTLSNLQARIVGATTHSILRCKGKGHWRTVWISITNTHGTATLTGFVILRHRGVLHYYSAITTIAAYGVSTIVEDIFLIDGDEIQIELTPSTGTIVAQLTVQAVHFSDSK